MLCCVLLILLRLVPLLLLLLSFGLPLGLPVHEDSLKVFISILSILADYLANLEMQEMKTS